MELLLMQHYLQTKTMARVGGDELVEVEARGGRWMSEIDLVSTCGVEAVRGGGWMVL
jgi:hypothetical protein